jgi:hypothetical protein
MAILLSTVACTAKPAAEPFRVSDSPPGTHAYDQDVFLTLLGNHERIRRTVREIPGGVETVTESDQPVVAALIRDHVHAMKGRLEDGRRLRQWDPLFRAVFDRAGQIDIVIEDTPNGVLVRETSTDADVARLIRAHAEVVSGFVARGTDESRLAHEPPAGLTP